MKKLLLLIFLFFFIVPVSEGASLKWRYCLTGGTTGCLDALNGSLLSDGDYALVMVSTGIYTYVLDADSEEVENSPLIISPDSNAGDKRWVLVLLNGEYITDDSIDDDALDFSDITLNDLTFDVGSTTKTEFGYLAGVTSAIQTQLNGKESSTSNDFDPDRLNGDTVDDNTIDDGLLPSGITRDTEWNTAAKINAATTDADFLTAEVDGSTTNEIEVVDETFNATNFNGGTASGVSQDDFYDLWHGIDTDDDGDIDALDATVWATKLSVADIDDTPVDSETAAPISSNWAYGHVADADPHTGYALESVLGTSLNADDLALETGALSLVAEIPHIDAAQSWSAEQTILDDVCVGFGTDSDVQICYDSTAVVLEFRNAADAPIFTFDLVNYSTGSAPTATPKALFYDSSGAGADLADKFAGSVWSNMTTTTEDAETSDIGFSAMIAGTEVFPMSFDGSIPAWNNGDYGTMVDTITDADGRSVSVQEAFGSIIYVTGASTITLPAIQDGMSVTVLTVGATAVSVDVNGADLIMLDGTALSDGDKITNTSTSGDMAVCTYYSADGWYCATDGWTDGN